MDHMTKSEVTKGINDALNGLVLRNNSNGNFIPDSISIIIPKGLFETLIFDRIGHRRSQQIIQNQG
jgi:hypothetical protein